MKFKYNFILITILCLFIQSTESDIVDLNKCLVYGPGLRSNFSLPVRYFYIQLVDSNSNNLTYSFGKDYFQINLIQQNNKPVRSHINILDQLNGIYIVRYRIFQNYKNLLINVTRKYDNGSVGSSPYTLNDLILEDNCYCPEQDLSKWYDKMGCNSTYTQIEIDMKKFTKKINMDKTQKLIIKKYNQEYSQSLCNYVILNNKIYRKCYGKYVDFKSFSDAILISLTKKVKLPDVEFFFNLGDWPLNEKNQNLLLPIISWCGSTESNDIVLPTYDLTESTLEMMNRQSLDLFSVRANIKTNWTEKVNKSFWRGRDSRQERLNLVQMSKKNPHLIDAKLTNMFFYTEPEHAKIYGPIVERTSFYDFFNYKYQLNIDGTVAAYRFPYLLAGNSVVFKQKSKFYEHFYADLKPYVHYIPIKNDLSNLADQINWALENDEKVINSESNVSNSNVQEISKNGADYTRDYLSPNHIMCYHVKLFEAYSKILSSKVQIREQMEYVNRKKENTQENSKTCECNELNLNFKSEF